MVHGGLKHGFWPESARDAGSPDFSDIRLLAYAIQPPTK